MLHQLALPLPPAYSHSSRDGFSFFRVSEQPNDPTLSADELLCGEECAALNRYLDDLCAFLKRTRLIQRHPDKFFNYIRGEDWRATATHLDGTLVTKEETDDTLTLCHAFQPLFSSARASPKVDLTEDDGASVMAELRTLVRDGPPPVDPESSTASAGLRSLQEFYHTTNRLMLSRQRRTSNDSARITLREPEATSSTDHGPCANVGAAGSEKERRQERILDLVLSRGMSPKKQHEVRIMRAAIGDLAATCAHTCATGSCGCLGSDAGPRTVINIGEGKGYVSRAVALAEGLQVVGIDCNPAHKERAVERVEGLIESSLGMRESGKGKDMINLLYEPRGDVASVTCRIGPVVDWTELLSGHVRTEHDRTHVVVEADPSCLQETEDGAGDAARLQSPPSDVQSSVERHAQTSTARCRACGKIIRLSNTAVLVKHANMHVKAASEQEKRPPASVRVKDADGAFVVPSPQNVTQWSVSMAQREYVEKLVETFYTPCADTTSAATSGATDGATKRPRQDVTDGERMQALHLRPCMLPRGTRAVVLCLRQALPPTEGQEATAEHPADEFCSATITAVGFNGAVGQHFVVFDEGSRRETLYLCASDLAGNGSPHWSGVEDVSASPELRQWWLTTSGGRRNALVVRVLPFLKPYSPTVRVPSLRDTVMIGLHPCGDLGSSVCRLFANSEARGLLLVSCCWHALTSDGFPLSRALKRRGLTTDKISLLLATQPLDMWATASAEGHKSSAKILFFRSLLTLVWASWAAAYRTQVGQADAVRGCGCGFAPMPPLEPTFLRKVSRVKESLRFPAFVQMVLAEYIFAATAKHTAYTWHTRVCADCREQQEAFLHGARATAVVQETARTYSDDYFAAFMGLTVLRMWMCHLVESLLLLDRALFLHETLVADQRARKGSRATHDASTPLATAVSLVPLFDGAISPRMYGIFARRAI